MPWRALPFWGGGSEVPARDLRESVANELGKAGPLPDGLPVLRWYLENERIDTFLEPVITALGKLGDKEANVLRGDLVTKPHENAIVLAEALKQLAAHQGTLPAEKLQPLLQNHRAVVRAAAGALLETTKRQGAASVRCSKSNARPHRAKAGRGT